MDEDYAWVPVVAGIITVFWILSMIPIWVYVTLGCLLAAGFVIWLLDACGVFHAIASWWKRKSADGRIRFRKGCWCVAVGIPVVILCDLFPIEAGIPVALLIALAFGTRWLVQRQTKHRPHAESSPTRAI